MDEETQTQTTPQSTEPAAPDTAAQDGAAPAPAAADTLDTAARLEQLTAQNATLQAELDRMRREHLSQEEQARLALDERETALSQREATLRDRENQLHAISAMENAGLCTGGITTQEMLPFVMGATAADIDRKVQALQSLLEKHARTQTDHLYQRLGGQPQQPRGDAQEGGAAVTFGKMRSQQHARAKEIRDTYTGGKRKHTDFYAFRSNEPISGTISVFVFKKAANPVAFSAGR